MRGCNGRNVTLSACASVLPLCCWVSAVRERGRDLFFWVIQSEWGTVRREMLIWPWVLGESITHSLYKVSSWRKIIIIIKNLFVPLPEKTIKICSCKAEVDFTAKARSFRNCCQVKFSLWTFSQLKEDPEHVRKHSPRLSTLNCFLLEL